MSNALGAMVADRKRVKQILLNLLSNAAKFTDHGQIILTVTRQEKDHLITAESSPQTNGNQSPKMNQINGYASPPTQATVSDISASSDWVIFSISDTGIGMTTEQMNKIFQPFVQADSSTTKKYGGTGLGLSICQRFCEMMGGSISVNSEVAVGSTFSVSLPTRVSQLVETYSGFN